MSEEEENQEKSEKSEENEENKSNQDEEENEVKEEKVENVEKEENEEPPETREEPEKEEQEKEEPEKEEPDGEEQENREEAENDGDVPTKIIIFSTLPKEEKKKYFNFFIANDTIFHKEPEGTWIAEIDIFDDDKQESNDLKLSKNEEMKNLRQSKFRSTKKDYDTIYSKLIKVINPPPGIKGTKMNISAIKYMIQEIYSLKFLKDTQALFNKEEVEHESFPVFVGNFLINKFSKKKDALYKKAIDFMLSLDFYGLKHKDIKIFQQFVTEEYDSDDLIFYLFVRSCIEKELKVFFLEKAKENLGQDVYGQEDDDIMIPMKKIEKLAKTIYGTDEEELYIEFMNNIKKLLETDAADSKKKHLKANAILNMSLTNYHESRGKVEEVDEDKEKENSDEEKKKLKKKHKKNKDDEDEDKKKKKHKHKHKKNKDDDEEDEEQKEEADQNEEEEEKEEEEEEEKETKIAKKEPTKLRAQKKTSAKTSSSPTKLSSGTKSKPSNTSSATKSSKSSKTTKASTIKTPVSKTTNQNKINAPKTTGSTSSKINTTGNTGVSKPVKPATTVAKPARKISPEKREANKDIKSKISPKKPQGSSSVGKRKQTSSVGKRTGPIMKDQVEQTPEFKKILNKNRIEKVKTDDEKIACLLYIINDYFKLKEIDNYFKNLVENNPIFKNFSAKIFANIKNTKEFTLKKLSGICKYVSVGDKNGFNNLLKAKDKGGKLSFENIKSSYNSLLKSGPLKNLNENEVGEFCKMILEIPELSVQTSKSLLKYCE